VRPVVKVDVGYRGYGIGRFVGAVLGSIRQYSVLNQIGERGRGVGQLKYSFVPGTGWRSHLWKLRPKIEWHDDQIREM